MSIHEASLALDASVSTVTASDLALRIWDDEHLNTQQRPRKPQLEKPCLSKFPSPDAG